MISMSIRKIILYLPLLFVFIVRLYFSFPDCNDKKNICYYNRYKEVDVIGIVDSEIDNNNFNLKTVSINDNKVSGVININYYGKSDINFSDKIQFVCFVKDIRGSYKKYLENKNIYLSCNMKDFDVVVSSLDIHYKIFNFVYNIKNNIIYRINNVFDKKYSGFLISFLLGDKRFISKRIENLMVNSGLSHITSISGFNISLIISFVYFLFIGIGINRKYIFYIILPMLFLFSIMTGLTPSVIRACVMSVFILFIQQIGRPYNSFSILFYVGYFMLMFNPKYIFDVSFLLSFISTSSIIFIESKIYKKTSMFVNNFISTLFIFITTSPIIFIFFGKLNFMSILNNLLILPFIPYLYLFSVLSIIFKPLSFIVYLILDYLYLLIGNL